MQVPGPAEQTTDPRWVPPEGDSALRRFFLPMMRDERDLIFVQRASLFSITVVPAGVGMFLLPSWAVALLAVPYLATVFLYWGGRYTLMLHAICHRPLFHSRHALWNRWIPWLLGPFMGHTPAAFYVHHIGMHHPENNLPADLSCTLPYKRDDLGHWLHYWARFFWFGYLHLPRYLLLRKRWKLLRWLVSSELSWGVGVAALLWLNWPAALVVFVLPYCIMRVAMMCGNFAQHAFVDVEDPDNAYRNSTCITNSRYNHLCYNDGYHIVHHLKPSLHWSELAQWYDDNRAEFAKNDAIVFDGIQNNQQIWFLLMTRNYRRLAENMVDFCGRSVEERIAMLKERVHRRRYPIRGLLQREQPHEVQLARRARGALGALGALGTPCAAESDG
ncbi:MAG TPA: fatty acid desaturase [Deltaproteobacteria bacterium]|nr:fatty acid desaturase [Deltaproteobacteria bacterium]